MLFFFNKKCDFCFAKNFRNEQSEDLRTRTNLIQILVRVAGTREGGNHCHQIIYVKFNLNVIYPPLYEREVWHYKLANSNCIWFTIVNFDWEKVYHNVDVNKCVMLFNETVLNIIWNFIPHKTVTFDDRDLT